MSAIKLRDPDVCVVIDLEKDVKMTDSCVVRVQNIGLMGERGVGIQLSGKGGLVRYDTKRDTTFIRGNFDTGIAEAMGMLGVVLGEVETLSVNVSAIVGSTVGDTAFLKLFHTMVARLDTLTNVAEKLVVKNQPLIDGSIQNVSTATTNLKALLEKNSGHIDAIMANGDALSAYSLAVAARVDSLTVSVKGIVTQVNNGQGSIGMLVKDEHFYTDLKKTVGDLDTLVNQVQGDALKLRIKLGFGSKKKKN